MYKVRSDYQYPSLSDEVFHSSIAACLATKFKCDQRRHRTSEFVCDSKLRSILYPCSKHVRVGRLRDHPKSEPSAASMNGTFSEHLFNSNIDASALTKALEPSDASTFFSAAAFKGHEANGYGDTDSGRTGGCTFHSGNVNNNLQFFPFAIWTVWDSNFSGASIDGCSI